MSEETKTILAYLRTEQASARAYEQLYKKKLISKLNEDVVSNDDEIAQYVNARDEYRTLSALIAAIEDQVENA